MSNAPQKKKDRLRSFKSSPYPLLFVVLPLLPVVLFVAGLIEMNSERTGLLGFLGGMLAALFSPVGLVLLLLFAGYVVHQRQLRNQRMWRKKRLPLFARLRFRLERAPQICAFCHDALNGEALSCPGCNVVLHTSCQAEALGCGTIGCEHEGRLTAVVKHKA